MFFIPARQNQLIQENILNNAPVRPGAIERTTNSALTASHNIIPFLYQQFDLR